MIQPITDTELDAIRQRTGGPVAVQLNRILKLGPYADAKTTVSIQRIMKLVNALPDAIKHATIEELKELAPVLEKIVALKDRSMEMEDAAPRRGSLLKLLADHEVGNVPSLTD